MKAKINVGYSATIQARQFHPNTTTDSMEIEVEVDSEEELLEKYEHFQELMQDRVIKNTMRGAKKFMKARDLLIEELEEE
jgi:nicotinate-nucleotide pyrophosphorylase